VVAVLGAAACLLVHAAGARAECVEGSPSVGVVLRDCEEDGLRWAEVRADLVAADVGVRVSRPSERGRTADAWGEGTPGVVVAVQGGGFRFPSWAPTGLTVGDGEVWDRGEDDARSGVVAFDERGAALVAPPEQVVPAEDWMRQVVSGPTVLRDGTAISECDGRACEAAPRSAVGLSEDGRTLVLLAVEGWVEGSAGVDDPTLGEMIRAVGAFDAIRVGEGATSVLWAREGGFPVPSSDGAPRPTAAFLAVVDRASGVTARIRGVVQQAADPMAGLPDARVRVETIDRRLVVESGTMTDDGYFEHVVPAREYFVRASHPGYRTGCKYCPVPEGGEMWCSLFLSMGDGEAACHAPGFGVDGGPCPAGDPEADAGPPEPDAGTAPPDPDPPTGSCSAAGSGPGPHAASWLLASAVLVLLRRRSR